LISKPALFVESNLLKAAIGVDAAKVGFVPHCCHSPSGSTLISFASVAKVGKKPTLTDASGSANVR